MAPKRVAILGGGVSAMTAAYYLTSYPGWKNDWDITVHQLGWRLGGKGASGRNRKRQQRIEEHGLHIFLGFYENAFATMRGLYGELGRRPDQPLAAWTDAWKPQDFVVFADEIEAPTGSSWDMWAMTFPRNSSTPGDGKGEWPTAWDYVQMLVGWITDWIERGGLGPFAAGEPGGDEWGKLRDAIRGELDGLRAHLDDAKDKTPEEPHPGLVGKLGELIAGAAGHAVHAAASAADRIEHVLGHVAHELVGALPGDPSKHSADDHGVLRWLLERLRKAIWSHVEHLLDTHLSLRHAFIMVDLWVSITIGMIVDGLIIPPVYWYKIDDVDFRAWIMRHGAARLTAYSGPINSAYALAFGEQTEIGAGTGMHGILRLIGGYKGSIFWEMQAGMGDTIFGPFYEVLRRRGVKFEFFHRVDRLEVAGGRVSRIHIGRPVTVKPAPDGSPGEYHPLVDVKGLPCWPSEPLYEQLVEGGELEASGADVEDWWTDWVDRGTPLVLEDGADFDVCILGVAIATFKDVAGEVLAASPKMAAMVDKVQTTQTQALQLWFGPGLTGLGWTGPKPIVGSYALWFDTWSDMTQLLPREDWPATLVPGSLAYLVSRLLDDEPMPPHRPEPAYTRRQLARVRANALDWLHTRCRELWPLAVETNDPGQLNWYFLVDPEHREGAARFDSQYIRATVNPSERYVLSVPGSTQYRLRAEDTGIANLLMTGDHTFTGINAGCVEAATMSGMNCAQALCGHPAEIVGDILPQPTAPPPGPPQPARPDRPAADAAAAGPAPRYVELPGEVVLRQPVALTGAMMYSWLIEADYDKLVALCKQVFDAPSRGAVEYRPLLPAVLLVCASIARGQSTDPVDHAKGWMPERDLGFWIPVVRGKTVGGRFEAEALAWYQPYLFIDNESAFLVGRETYGFRKYISNIQFPDTPRDPAAFVVDTLVIKQFGPDQEGAVAELWRASREGPRGELEATFASIEHLIEHVLPHLRARFEHRGDERPVPTWQLIEELIRDMIHGLVPMAFLRQFRDVADAGRAALQQIVEAPCKLDRWHGAGIARPHRLVIQHADSHPIVDQLGLAGPDIDLGYGVWMSIDFTMDNGAVRWRAG